MGLKHRIPHVAALACALPFFVVAVAMAADDSGPDGGAAELREGAFRVRFRDCPTCEMRMRVSPEASIAFVNTSRVGAADRPAVAARAFAGLRLADAARRDAIADALVEGDKIQIVGFGTFEVKARAARQGHNPLTGEKIQIPAAKHPAFSASKALKDAVNK